MKIDEIKLLPKQSGINPFDISVLTDLQPYKNANVEGAALLFARYGRQLFFVVLHDGVQIAFAKATQIKKPITALVINRTFVVPSMQNKGWITALYRTLRGAGNVIISDIELSPESISVWKKLIAHFSVSVIDAHSGIIKRQATIQDLDAADSVDERLLLDQYKLFGRAVLECGMGITRETEIFVGTQAP